MRRIAVGLIAAMAMLLAPGRLAVGEVFVLGNGGQVTGELLNPDESPRKTFIIKTSTGGQITLDRSQVVEVHRPSPEELLYERIRPNYPDTVEGQWALAEWCRGQQLTAQRKRHLQRVIELDANHAEARQALGYSQIDGRWMTPEEVKTERGLKRYKGRWRTAQEIQLSEEKRKLEDAEKDWAQKLKRWRGWLGTKRDADGRRNILTIDDPRAVKALAWALKEDPSRQARIMFIEVLARLNTPEAVDALAQCSLLDPVEEVRLTCLDYLEKEKRPAVVAYYVEKLRAKDNVLVNRAAVGLGRMNDPSAIRPLIDALVTSHKCKVVTGRPGGISTTFGTGPGGSGLPGTGLALNNQPRIITQQIRNQSVLDALGVLTKRNFGFDVQAWRTWYASYRKAKAAEALPQ